MKALLHPLIFLSFLLAGCFDYTEHWTYYRNGNAKVEVSCSLSQEFLDANPGLSFSDEKVLLSPCWITNMAAGAKTAMSSGILTNDGCHAIARITITGSVKELSKLPVFKDRTIVLRRNRQGLSLQQRFKLPEAEGMPYSGSYTFRHDFPGALTADSYPILGKKSLGYTISSEDFSKTGAIVISGSCRYPAPWPWREALYVAACFLCFFLVAKWQRNMHAKEWPVPAPVPGDLHSIPGLLSQAACLYESLPAIMTTGARGHSDIGFSSLASLSHTLAHYLISRGLKKGGRAAVIISSGKWRNISILGIQCAGGVPVPLSPALSKDEISSTLKRLNVTHVIAEEDFREKIPADIETSCIRSAKNLPPDFLDGFPTSAPMASLLRESPALLLPGQPDVILTHGELLCGLFAAASMIPMTKGDRLISAHDPASPESLQLTCFLPLVSGFCSVFPDRLDPDRIALAIQTAKVSALSSSIPTALAVLSRCRRHQSRIGALLFPSKGLALGSLFGLQYVFVSGGLLPKTHVRFIRRLGLRFRQCVFLRECAGLALASTGLCKGEKSEVRILPCLECKIENGVLFVRGSSLPTKDYVSTGLKAVQKSKGTIRIK